MSPGRRFIVTALGLHVAVATVGVVLCAGYVAVVVFPQATPQFVDRAKSWLSAVSTVTSLVVWPIIVAAMALPARALSSGAKELEPRVLRRLLNLP